MKKNEIERIEKIKRIKMLDNFLLFFGKNKVGFKEITDKKHLTLKFLNEGLVDIHETIEGKIDESEKHQRIGTLDLRKFAKAFEEIFRREILTFLKEIDVNSPRFQNIEVSIIPTKEELRKKIQVHKKSIKIENSELSDLVRSVPMNELQGNDFRLAFMTEDNKTYALYHIDDKYYSIRLDDFSKIIDKIIEKSLTQNQ